MIKTPVFARLLSCIVMCVAITVVRADEQTGTRPIDIGSRRERHDDLPWMSYYSSHERKTSIYLAKIKFKS